MIIDSQLLFNLAYGLAEGRIDGSGHGAPPAELTVAVSDATGLDDSDAIVIARIVLRAMTCQRAVDMRLSGGDYGAADPDGDYSDCAYG